MDVKTAFVVGIAHVVFFICGCSQNITDDVVYTEVKKTLVSGTTGILRCAFRGEPNAVFWKKGFNPEKSPSVIVLSYGDLYGPRYEDGSCDIDDNYSLVFNQVTESDAGRYICRVSNLKGILIHNFTDVTITNTPVRTEESVSVQKGTIGVLPCRIYIRHRKVSWVRGANDKLITVETSHHAFKRSGHLGGVFDTTKDNSLVINKVNILHDGSYTCQVTDYDTGHVFQNTTELHVFAYPLEPFPSIKECPEGQQDVSSCTLRIKAQTTITCEVMEYYPDVDLFFRHGSSRIDSVEKRVWNNTDGTKNKVIKIKPNGTSETIFECVASGLIGKAKERTMTVHLIRDGHHSRVIMAVVIPVTLLFGSILIGVYIIKRRNKPKYVQVPTMGMAYKAKRPDLISYIELWKLVEYGMNESRKLENALRSLMPDDSHLTVGNETPSDTPLNIQYYDRFCNWKAKYSGHCQKEDCLKACHNAGLKSANDYSNSTPAVSSEDLEHTQWHIPDTSIPKLLEELGVVLHDREALEDREEQDVIGKAMNTLKHWRDINMNGNQEVMLSLALEAINYTPSDMDFFRIPDGKKSELNRNEIEEMLLPDLASRHCSVLIDAMEKYDKTSWYRLAVRYFGSSKKKVWIENIIEQNMTSLFDSHQMLKDWWAEQKCSNYEKRLELQRAAKNTEKAEIDKIDGSYVKWLTTNKIEQIINLVPEESMMKLCKSLKFSCRPEDLKETLFKWRANIPKEEHHKAIKELSEGLQSINFGGLICAQKGTPIYKAELVDLALDLIMDDLRPLAKTLGITDRKLFSYRKVFQPSHLDLGTIRLVLKLVDRYRQDGLKNKDIRVSVCQILDKAGYLEAPRRFIYAFEPSYGELHSLMDDWIPVETQNETRGDHEHEDVPDSLESGDIEVKVEEVDERPVLQTLFGLTNDDMKNIPDANIASRIKVFEVWKEKVCPGLVDHRVALAEGLMKIDKGTVLRQLINGKFKGRETSLDFIKNMLSKRGEDQQESLRRLLQIKCDKEDWPQSELSQQICRWVSDWIEEMESLLAKCKDLRRIKQVNANHRHFNDKLVENGFYDLAREIMIIEQGF